jgi:hypothetical protein
LEEQEALMVEVVAALVAVRVAVRVAFLFLFPPKTKIM